MYRLIYASQAKQIVDINLVKEILIPSNRENNKRGITGVLLSSPDYFLQCLEGNIDLVNDVYLKIAKDPRHKKCEIISAVDGQERIFSQWSMGYVFHTNLNKVAMQKYMGSETFNPYLLSAENSELFLRELIPFVKLFDDQAA